MNQNSGEEKDTGKKEEANANAPAANEKQLKEEDQKEQILRLIAEFDNYKKRAKNDIDNAKIIGKAELLKNLLSVIDEFDLALLALSEMKDRNIVKGIELLYSNFIAQLRKEGLEETDSNGTFDPYKHEIIISAPSAKPYGTILEVVKKGYMFKGIMLRPASVIISNGKENKKNEKEGMDGSDKQNN
ncbi:nucleotide exchange factor GrpE [Candidatus Marsarchaeota archaeon]|nr:nucleotide exchange factor GrpE [Candidatus Marsarchaeota archaeon]